MSISISRVKLQFSRSTQYLLSVEQAQEALATQPSISCLRYTGPKSPRPEEAALKTRDRCIRPRYVPKWFTKGRNCAILVRDNRQFFRTPPCSPAHGRQSPPSSAGTLACVLFPLSQSTPL